MITKTSIDPINELLQMINDKNNSIPVSEFLVSKIGITASYVHASILLMAVEQDNIIVKLNHSNFLKEHDLTRAKLELSLNKLESIGYIEINKENKKLIKVCQV
jgi:hypothetical protein